MTSGEVDAGAGAEEDGPAHVPRPEASPDAVWYRSFFTGLALDMWEQAVPPQVTAAELDLAADLLDLDPEEPTLSRVLDVPCGTGRLSVELAVRGYAVTAFDGSAESLRRLRAAAAEVEIEGSLEVRQGDMTALPFESEFRGVVCLGNSFGYGPLPECRAFLGGVARALQPGGCFLMHTAVAAECLLPGLAPEEEMRVGDVQVAFENRYDPLAGRLDTRFVLSRWGERFDRLTSHFVFTVAEIGRLMAAAGLELEAAFGDPHGTPFELGASEEVYLLARKPQ